MRLLLMTSLVACAFFLNAQVENGCISIDFESFPDDIPSSGLVLSDQFQDAFGLSFRLEGGGFPVLAEVGGTTAEAFGSAFGNDTPAPGNDIGQFFLTDDGQLSGLTSPPIILDFESPIDSFAGCILDMDFQEFFIIQALDASGSIILEERFDAGDPDTGDGVLTCWGFNLPGCEGSIYSIRYAGFRPASSPGAFGLGMDFFSFCYSGLAIDTEISPVTCDGLGSVRIYSTTNEVYEYSLDGITFSTNGFFDQLEEGIQVIYVRDIDNCITTVDVNVESDIEELPDPIFVDAEICQGQSFSFNGEEYSDAGMFQQTLIADNGCDTLWNLTLTVNPNSSEIINPVICDGESFILNGVSYSVSGRFEQELMTSESCDSIIEINLTVNPNTEETINTQICEGETYILNGETYTVSGIYSQELSNQFDCDSLLNLNLEVIESITESVSTEVCDGESFVLNGEVYTVSGNFFQTLSSTTGCDSIVEINLVVNPNTEETMNAQICEGEAFTLNGETFTVAGLYRQQLVNELGCDSLLTLNIEVKDVTTGFLSDQICEGETFELNGESYTSSGIFTQQLINAEGCDSLLILQLDFSPASTSILSEEICEGANITINGTSYSAAGSFTQILLNSQGCDSLLDITISILPTIETCESVSIFEGETFTLNGESFAIEGTYQQLLQTPDGCDSLVIIKLDVLPMPIAIIHYDLDNCAAGGTSYEEFVPESEDELECAELDASLLNRPSGLPHSCTPGTMGSGMCVSSEPSCQYLEDSEHRLVFEVEINPITDPLTIAGLRFFEKAPIRYEFNVGNSGLNNYPTLYAFRVLKDTTEIYFSQSVMTNREWTEQSFNFSGMDSFVFNDNGTLTVEFLAFCPIGISSRVSAWDIDELSLLGYCEIEDNRVVGKVITSKVEPLAHTTIGVQNANDWDYYTSDDNGEFAFDIQYNQSSVLIEPYNNNDPLIGVSTLDLIQIQRHILGRETFDDLTNIIAADINKDELITALDLIELRKLILGVYEDFPDNTSWRFLDSNRHYTSLSDVDDQMMIRSLNEEINLEAIKVGDVNQSYKVNVNDLDIKNRSQSKYKLTIQKRRNINGQLLLGLLASEDIHLSGLQAAFHVGNNNVLDIQPHSINISDQNYNIEKDVLKVTWSCHNQEVSRGDLLFEFVIKENENVESIYLDSDYQNEIYHASDLKVETLVMEQEIQQLDSEDTIQFKINPNPFSNETTMQITSKERLTTEYKIVDATGQLIQSKAVTLESGINQIDLNRNKFSGPGIYFIMIQRNQSIFIERVIIL